MNYNIDLLKQYLADAPFDPLSLGVGLACGLVFWIWRRATLTSKIAALVAQQGRQLESLSKLEGEKGALEEKLSVTMQDLVRNETEKTAFERQILENRADLEKMEKKFEVQFENLAHKIFEEKTKIFKKQSQENLDVILSPLKEKLSDFQKKVDDSFGNQAKEQFALKEQIKMIVEANDKITLQAEGLTNALRGDSKTQGDWGEVQLENILQNSGLRKDEDYILQGTGLGMKDSETGKLQKPDVIINLPEDKHVILDSKVSLTHYERYFSEDDDVLRSGHLKQFLASVKKHVTDLKERRYQETDKLGTPDFVLMFMPIESAYMLALQEDRNLHQFAWEKGVAIVCPSTLFSTLRTIASLWRLVLQNKNSQEIARQGGALYDKIAGFVGDMQSLGKNLKTLEGTYESAMNKLSTGQGNILGRTEKIKALGAKAAKSLPTALVESDEISNDEQKDEAA